VRARLPPLLTVIRNTPVQDPLPLHIATNHHLALAVRIRLRVQPHPRLPFHLHSPKTHHQRHKSTPFEHGSNKQTEAEQVTVWHRRKGNFSESTAAASSWAPATGVSAAPARATTRLPSRWRPLVARHRPAGCGRAATRTAPPGRPPLASGAVPGIAGLHQLPTDISPSSFSAREARAWERKQTGGEGTEGRERGEERSGVSWKQEMV
jgi:hypothetical protein